MLRIAVFLVLLFLVLLAARVLRFLWAAVSRARTARAVEGEMVRDPVCGVWVDRRLAIAAGAAQVCSEGCRRALEEGAAAP